MSDMVQDLQNTFQQIFDLGNTQIKTDFVTEFVFESNRIIHTNIKDAYKRLQKIADVYADRALNDAAAEYASRRKPVDIICP